MLNFRHYGISLRAWCLALQCLTIVCNQPLRKYPNLDGFTPLSPHMASCIVKERNTGPMLLRLLSGDGLNINTMDKQYIMVRIFPFVALFFNEILSQFDIFSTKYIVKNCHFNCSF